ncbi:MAG TPA: hypothetical protein DDZ57_04945 [Porphyromonadaceae bacterium]|jgi:hypothetical protein|nr:hypothetical protein [Porphyromonadaceae bacterium]
MENNKSKQEISVPAIDQESILSLVADNDGITRIETPEKTQQAEVVPQTAQSGKTAIKDAFENTEPPKENRKRKSKTLADYDTAFLKSSTMQAKGGKTVYIRPEHHARMMRIINTIGKNNLSITDYLDNVLDQHFKDYESDINSSFRENFKTII